MSALLLALGVLALFAGTLFVLWRRSRALAAATAALRESHARSVADQERTAFLADVTRLLIPALDASSDIIAVARRTVPFLADACMIDLVDEQDALARVAAVHRVPAVLEALVVHYPAQRVAHPLLRRVFDGGRMELLADAQAADFLTAMDEPMRPVSALLVPLIARDRTLGVLSLFAIESGRRFAREDTLLVDELAGRIALAVDNRRLFRVADDAHHRFHDLVYGLGAVVWEADAVRRHHTAVDGRPAALLGYELARWLDQPDFWLAIQDPEDRGRSAAQSRAARAEGVDHDLEYRVRTADGRVVWILDLIRPVRRPDGSVRRLRGVMVDVTERKQAQAAVEQASALASVAALANAAAHEINNPLTIIIGNLELLARHADTPSALGVRIDAMQAAGRRIAAIVGSMRTITRLESSPVAPELPTMLDLKRSGAADDSRVA